MSLSSFSPIYPDRVTLTEILKNSRERNLLHLQDEMNMVCHQAEGMDEMGKFLLALLKKEVKPVAILITRKDILSGISTNDDMIDSTRIMNTRLTCHNEIE